MNHHQYFSPASLRCCPRARHIYPSLVLVQPRKTRPYITERLLMARKETKQTNHQYFYFGLLKQTYFIHHYLSSLGKPGSAGRVLDWRSKGPS